MSEPISTTRLRQIIGEELPRMVEVRRDLHAHPELMFQEQWTSARVRDELTSCGIPVVEGLAGGTGVIGFIAGHDPSTGTVGLRADMDALPIVEENGFAHRSTNEGLMHACGHDGHTAVLVGAAKVLKRLADEWVALSGEPGPGRLPRPVRFVFQPAEEGGAGGRRMIDDGCLKAHEDMGPAVTEMYGLHCWPQLELGVVTTRVGPLLAATDHFAITVHGKGGHAAWPQLTHDPVTTGAEMVMALQTIASRNSDPLDSVVLSLTVFHAGTARNVIAPVATIGGTLRTLSDATRAFAKDRLTHIADHVAAAHHCSISIEWEGEGYPVTSNHPDPAARVFEAARSVVARPELVQPWPTPVMGGEDFAFYCQEVPSCFFLLGQQPREAAVPYPMVHTPTFDFNDDSMVYGVEMFCRLALGRAMAG